MHTVAFPATGNLQYKAKFSINILEHQEILPYTVQFPLHFLHISSNCKSRNLAFFLVMYNYTYVRTYVYVRKLTVK